MKLSILSSLAVASLALADQETMDRLMSMKLTQREAHRAAGAFAPARYSSTSKATSKAVTKCKNGKAGEYACENVDMHSFLSHEEMGSKTREGNDIWGMLCFLTYFLVVVLTKS